MVLLPLLLRTDFITGALLRVLVLVLVSGWVFGCALPQGKGALWNGAQLSPSSVVVDVVVVSEKIRLLKVVGTISGVVERDIMFVACSSLIVLFQTSSWRYGGTI